MIADALAEPSPATGTFTRELGQHYVTSTETTANRQIFKKMLCQHDLMSTKTTENRHTFKRQQTVREGEGESAGVLCIGKNPRHLRQREWAEVSRTRTTHGYRRSVLDVTCMGGANSRRGTPPSPSPTRRPTNSFFLATKITLLPTSDFLPGFSH